MGLGHATRSLPLIQEFLRRRWVVYIGSSGRAGIFLKQEVPDAAYIELPDYSIKYDEDKVKTGKLLSHFPRLLQRIKSEQILLESVVQKNNIDLVVSDHRYGCYSSTVPSVFVSHQLRFITPSFLKPFEFVGKLFNQYFHNKYHSVIVPDYWQNGEGMLSGRLSKASTDQFYRFPGILSSIPSQITEAKDIDVLISISGPEPQRTKFESIIRDQITQINGKVVIGLGKPETIRQEFIKPDIQIYHHLDRDKMTNLIHRSRFLVARSGYSTVMEIAELGKKALFIPTPGQTEQLYLANRFNKKGWFYTINQSALNLKEAIQQAKKYPGFPQKFSTEKTVESVFNMIEKMLKI